MIETAGLIILDNHTVCNQEGKIISYDGSIKAPEDKAGTGLLAAKKLLLK